MNLKKIVTLFLLVLVIFTASCASEVDEVDLLESVKNKGNVVVAMEGTWAPWTYHDEKGDLVGFDVEVAKEIGKILGVEVLFVEGEWDGLLEGLSAGRYDMMVNGVEETEERGKKFDFSIPYAYMKTALIVRKDNDYIKSFEDLKDKTTANTVSSTYASIAERYGAKVTGVDDLNQTFELLLSGRIDATLNAEVTYYDYIKEHKDANIKIAALTEDVSNVVIPMRKGKNVNNFKIEINKAIEILRENGTLSELSKKYFGVDVS